MQLVINGESRNFDSDSVHSIADLLGSLDIEVARGVAVAVGDEVVPRGRWEEHKLSDGDSIEIIRATQGG